MPIDHMNIHVPMMFYGQESLTENEKREEFLPARELPLFSVEYSISGLKRIVQEIRQKQFDDWDWYKLSQQADALSLVGGFSELLCVEYLADRWKRVGVVPYPHQITTVKKVLTELRGQAILADEVGLGKTIEAGIVLKEYMLRNLVQKALILTPASLCWQWYQELHEKFGITAGIQRSQWDWSSDILIASIDTAKRRPHCDIIRDIPYDLVIVDEAHKLKNSSTASWKLVNDLQKKYCLMLTATPVQNDLKELYNLITLLKPGQLGSYRSFKKKFVKDKRTPKNPEELRGLLSQVLIRNRRGEGTVQFTARRVHPAVVSLTKPERDLYDQVTSFIRQASTWGPYAGNLLPLITLQREVCSSFYAAGLTLQAMCERHGSTDDSPLAKLLASAAEVRHNSKCDMLEQLLPTLEDKVLIFTEYRATQEYIRYRLEKAGYQTLGFDGTLSRGRKEWVRHLFQQDKQVLVSTESGGEGLNFQFCNQVVNYDLPWNPMRLEQRIGRVHRLGQTRDVHIYNLVTKDTIEEHIMYLLHQKIGMFEMVLGELDAILIHLGLDKSIEGTLMDIFLNNEETERIRAEVNQLGDGIRQGLEQVRSSQWDLI